MLVDEDDSNILSLGCEAFKCGLDRRIICLVVHDEEVLRLICASAHMLLSPSVFNNSQTCGRPMTHADACEQQSGDGVLERAVNRQFGPG